MQSDRSSIANDGAVGAPAVDHDPYSVTYIRQPRRVRPSPSRAPRRSQHGVGVGVAGEGSPCSEYYAAHENGHGYGYGAIASVSI